MPGSVHSTRILSVTIHAWVGIVGMSLCGNVSMAADFPAPPPPQEYNVVLRYQIYATLDQRIPQFQELVRYLESIGFRKKAAADPRAEMADPHQTRMEGTISSGQVRKMLLDRHVKALLLIPMSLKLPEDGAKPVKVQLELVSGMSPDRQRLLADQVLDKLRSLDFREAIGYDHRGHTRLVGWIPTENLQVLLQDLRYQPANWLAPETPLANLPEPLRNQSPILIAEVLAEPQGPPQEPPAVTSVRALDNSQKIALDLRRLATQVEAAKATRMQVILTYTPDEFEVTWRREFVMASPGIVIEGRLGSVVTVVGPPKMAMALSALSNVSAIRLPVPAMSSLRSAALGGNENQSLIQKSGIARLHLQGKKGQEVRVAVIDGDFRGYERLLGKGLPAKTQYVDFTADRNTTIVPDPFPGDPQEVGQGTQVAAVLSLAAPDVNLTLIRVDPTCPYQVVHAARLIRGDVIRSDTLAQRDEELTFEKARLRSRREDLRLERKAVVDDFRQDEELDREIVDRRKAYFKKLAELEADEQAYQQKLERFIKANEDQRALKGIKVVACSLVWNAGYPLGGASAISRFLNDSPFPALWFEPAGNQREQAWAGPFRDADGNGVMEFAPAGTSLHQGRWTPELNFLAWQPFNKERSPDLPAKATVRISIQWQEVHDPEFALQGDDVYREPSARLELVVLRQRDPAGAQLPADDLEWIARSQGLPLRIESRLDSAVYEQALEFPVPSAGRYALRVEGQVHTGTRPPTAPTLPGIERNWELQPRIFIEVMDEPSRLAGRPAWLDYFTDLGSIGVPSDAHASITLGAADGNGKPESFSSDGPPMHLRLLLKPDALAFDQIKVDSGKGQVAFGTGLSMALAAGQAADLLSGRMTIDKVRGLFFSQDGQLLRLP